MKTKGAVLLACLVLITWLSYPASAQFGMGMKPPEVRGVFNPVVGGGADYVVEQNNGKKQNFQVAVVEKASTGGYWMEYAISEERGTMYMKYLMSRQGDDAVIMHTIFQMPGQPPIDASTAMQMPGMSAQNKPQKVDIRAEAQNLGTESVTTPAGTFSCQHWRTKDGNDVWISDKVTPWGLVKMTGKATSSITLQRVVTDAKSHITGTPLSMQQWMERMKQ